MVISTVNQVIYNGDGSTVAWPYTFRIIDDTDIKLTLIDSDESETAITSDYFVDTANNTVYYPGYAPGAEPPEEDQPPKVASGQKLLIYRELPVTQTKNLGEKWPFATIELGLDKLTMILQQVYGWWGRCLHISAADQALHPTFDMTFPIEAGKSFRVNSTATGFEASDDPGTSAAVAIEAASTATAAAAAAEAAAALVDVQAIWYDSVADMVADNIPAGNTAGTKGYYSVNDGGNGVYNIREATVSDVDDGGSIIFLDNGNVAELIHNGTVNAKQYGAKGDGVTNDVPHIQAAVDTANVSTVVVGNGDTFLLGEILYINKGVTIDLNGSMLINGTGGTFVSGPIRNFHAEDVTLGYAGVGNITIKNGTLKTCEALFAHGENITIENVDFRNSTGHFLQFMSCYNVVIRGCTFVGMLNGVTNAECINLDPCLRTAFPFYDDDDCFDGTNNSNVLIENNICKPGTDSGYTGDMWLGVSHTHGGGNLYQDNVTIRNNYITNSGTKQLLYINQCRDSRVYDNVLDGHGAYFIFMRGGLRNSVYNNKAYNLDGTDTGVLLKIDEYGERNISVFDNVLSYFAPRWMSIKSLVGTVTFKRCDPLLVYDGNSSVDTYVSLLNPNDPNDNLSLSMFNTLYVTIGSVDLNTYRTNLEISSYGTYFTTDHKPTGTGANPVGGYNASDSVTVTIDTENTQVKSNNKIRRIYVGSKQGWSF